MPSIDFDYFEYVIFQQCLKKDDSYLSMIIDFLDKDLFKNKKIGSIIEIITGFYLEHSVLPSMTEIKVRINTKTLRKNLLDIIEELKTMDVQYNEQELLTNTESFIKQRKYSNLIEKAIDERTSSKIFNLEDIQIESEKIHNISLIDNLGLDYFGDIDKVKEYLQQKDSLISTGYPTLDDAFGGGFQKEGKAIYDVGGETNVGKSILLANIAVNVLLQDHTVVIISPEMSEMRYAKRISGILTEIALSQIGDDIENFDNKIYDYVEKYKKRLIIKEVPTKAVNAKQIYAYLKKLKEKKKIDISLICIDGHSLLKPSVVQPSKHAELQFITQECRGLSYSFEAPVLTVAQLNRGAHRANNPGLDNMAGSWDQLADFDGHVNIWQTDEDREANIIRFGGKKVRDGAKGKDGFLNINYDTLKLTEEVDPDNIDIPDIGSVDLSDVLNID